jgi:hypothetical protein
MASICKFSIKLSFSLATFALNFAKVAENKKTKKKSSFLKFEFFEDFTTKMLLFFLRREKKKQMKKPKISFFLKSKESVQKIKCFLCFRLVNFLVLLKHILLKKEHDLLVFQLFVSKHFYEYFFLILMYVFVTLKF